jgi:hypothetical protein
MFRKRMFGIGALVMIVSVTLVVAGNERHDDRERNGDLDGTGPSSSESPYLVPVEEGVGFISILTAGDEVKRNHKGDDAYRMVGLPDGLGAYDNGGTITLLMNHELSFGQGLIRDHGGNGAFVSRWEIRKSDLKVQKGEDLMQRVLLWDSAAGEYYEAPNATFSRFCSADLPAASAFYNRRTRRGFRGGRIFMNGEEDGSSGRAMAHVSGGRYDGTSYELPLMGHHAWENLLASPYEQNLTIVAGNEDGGLNNVFFYVGEKQRRGSPIDQAGLSNGTLYQLLIPSYTDDDPSTGFRSGPFSLVTSGGTSLARPEDGQWDTVDPNRYYFVTTASFSGNSRLWRATFDDIRHPEQGGTIEVLVDGQDTIKMMDNLTVDGAGNVYMQEDVGGQTHLGSVWMYNPRTHAVTKLAEHDPERFLAGAPDFLTEDEESSGIIEVTEMFSRVRGYNTRRNRYFLLDVQAHYSIPGELVQGGQLLLMSVPRD